MSHDEDDDDDALWAELIRSVKPLPRAKEVVMPEPPRRKAVTRPRDDNPLIPVKQVTPSPLPQRQIKKLKTQRIAIEAQLDLHGYTVQRAHEAVNRFIHNAIRHEMRCLEIITGRGDLERGTGQLKRMVPEWLRDPAIGPMILHAELNPVSRGGSLLVLLRRSRNG